MHHFAIPSPNGLAGGSRSRDSDFKQLFGLSPTAKWPEQGMLNEDASTKDVWVEGSLGKVQLWVEPRRYAALQTESGVTRRKLHRVMCRCPRCGAVMSAGRLEQHAKVHYQQDYLEAEEMKAAFEDQRRAP